MISQTAEYALRAVVDLAYHQGESRTTQEIAAATLVPAGYLAKVLKDLARKEIVRSQRGPSGGFTLIDRPETISVFDVIQAVDPLQRIRSCPLKLEAHRAQLCPLHKRLDDAMSLVEQAFKQTSIAEVTAEPTNQPMGGPKSKLVNLNISGGLAPNPSSQKTRREP